MLTGYVTELRAAHRVDEFCAAMPKQTGFSCGDGGSADLFFTGKNGDCALEHFNEWLPVRCPRAHGT